MRSSLWLTIETASVMVTSPSPFTSPNMISLMVTVAEVTYGGLRLSPSLVDNSIFIIANSKLLSDSASSLKFRSSPSLPSMADDVREKIVT